jgi:hypothetical protein
LKRTAADGGQPTAGATIARAKRHQAAANGSGSYTGHAVA